METSEKLAQAAITEREDSSAHVRALTPRKCVCKGTRWVTICEGCGGAGWNGKMNKVCGTCAGTGCVMAVKA